MFDIALRKVSDFDALGKRWRELERDADAHFFQTWTFLGCLAEERFSNASILSLSHEGRDFALALLGQAGKRFYLNETGNPERDSVFIEHNALLTRSAAPEIAGLALRYVLQRLPTLKLSGIPETLMQAAAKAGWLRLRQKRDAPFAVLKSHEDPLAYVSATLRAQIKRAQRCYHGDVTLERAESMNQALDHFAELAATHQRAWLARGKPGAFATASIRHFHETLIRRAWPNGEVDLLRIAAGPRHIGSLYNFVKNGRVYAYQSGFVYGRDNREKPGLLCHAIALRHYARSGLSVYDFLAGADRYKLSFAQASQPLYWADLHARWSIGGILSAIRIH